MQLRIPHCVANAQHFTQFHTIYNHTNTPCVTLTQLHSIHRRAVTKHAVGLSQTVTTLRGVNTILRRIKY